MLRRGVVRVERCRKKEARLRIGPVPFVHVDLRQYGVCLGQRIILGKCLKCRSIGGSNGLVTDLRIVIGQQNIRRGERRGCTRKSRVAAQSCVIELDALTYGLVTTPVPLVTTLQIELVCLYIRCRCFAGKRSAFLIYFWFECELQLLNDGSRDLILNFENI